MEDILVIQKIKAKFVQVGNPTQIPLLRGEGSFKAKYSREGINVNNLGSKPFLPWVVFTETLILLENLGGSAKLGNAMNSKLGDLDLPLTSVEGYIANKIYGIQIGGSVFRRITPITDILIWAGLCKHEKGNLILLK